MVMSERPPIATPSVSDDIPAYMIAAPIARSRSPRRNACLSPRDRRGSGMLRIALTMFMLEMRRVTP